MHPKNKFLRFIGAGIVNTIASYSVYLFLIFFFSYQISYACAFVFGIALSFVLNSKYVFEVQQTLRKFILFPLVYLVQYLLGALLMGVVIEVLGVSKLIAPLFVIICLMPVSYLLSKKILQGVK